jgi:hypothetical protein
MTHNPSTMNLEYLKRLVAVKKGRAGLFQEDMPARELFEQNLPKKNIGTSSGARERLEKKLGFLRKKEIHLHINRDHGRRTTDWLENHRSSLEKKLQEEEKKKTMCAAGQSPDGVSPYTAYCSGLPGIVSTMRLVNLKNELALTRAMKIENKELLGNIEKAIARIRVMIEIHEQSLNRLDNADITGSR